VQPLLVIGNPHDDGTDTPLDRSVVRIAREGGLETIVGLKAGDPAVLERLRACAPDVVFNMYGTALIPTEALTIPNDGFLNMHPAPLPRYRGRFSTVHAIFNDEREHGVTLHRIDEGIDSGPIIAQRMFPIHETDTAEDVWNRATDVGVSLFNEFLESWIAGAPIVATPQDESKATYYPKGLPNNGEIDWSWDGATIKRFIRAMTFPPYPPPAFPLGERVFSITENGRRYERDPR
jgi:methionyl-tRNA formyltransferase